MSLRTLLKRFSIAALTAIGLASAAHAETVVSVTQTSYDYLHHPVCTAVRMNTAVYGSLPTADPTSATWACTPGTTVGSYGKDRITRTYYDAAYEPFQVVQAYGTTDQRTYATYNYGNDGEVLDVIDSLGLRSHSQYDGLNRLKEFDYPSPTLPTAYDPSNALATAGTYNTVTCDTSHTADCEAYTYDLNNNRVSERRRDATMIYDCYDNLDRTVRESIGSTSCATSGGGSADVFTDYDGLGRIKWKSFVSKDNTPGVTYAYDGLGRVTSTTDFNGRTVSYLYNQASAKTRVTYPDGSYVDYGTLDALNRVGTPTHSSGSTLYALTYNSLGQRIKLNRGAGNVVTNYTLDGLGRLSVFNDDLPSTANDITWTFTYTPAGQVTNWSASSAVYDYKEPATTTVNQTYDGLNRDTAIVSAGGYDLRGNMLKDATRAMTYDVFNRFLSSAPVGSPSLHNADLQYDPEGRVYKYSENNGSSWTTLVYDGTNMIAEYSGTSSTVLAHYVFGPGTDEPIVWYKGSGFTDRHYLVANYQGSIIATLDSAYALENTYEYGAYGEPEINGVKSSNYGWGTSSSAPRFRYTGQMSLNNAQLYHYKARVYDPIYGHFMQTDPIGADDDLDLYAYTGDDPVNESDPSGERAYDCVVQTYANGTMGTPRCTEDMSAFPIGTEIETRFIDPDGKGYTESDDIFIGQYLTAEDALEAQIEKMGLHRIFDDVTQNAQVPIGGPNDSPRGGGRNAQKYNPDRRQQAAEDLEKAREKLRELESKPNKTPDDKDAIARAKRAVQKAIDDYQKSENHSMKKKR